MIHVTDWKSNVLQLQGPLIGQKKKRVSLEKEDQESKI